METITSSNSNARSEPSETERLQLKLVPGHPTTGPRAYGCLRCHDSGWRVIDERDAMGNWRQTPCDSPDCPTRLMQLQLAGVDKRYWKATLDDFQVWPDQPDLYPQVIHALQNDRGLVLYGTVGNGKSHMAVAILRTFLDVGRNARITKTRDLLFEIQATFGRTDGPTTEKVVARYRDCGLFVLDDVGTEKQTEWSRDVFYAILDAGYSNFAPIVLTANLRLAQLRTHLGPRLHSRLTEVCAFVEFTGPDLRLRI